MIGIMPKTTKRTQANRADEYRDRDAPPNLHKQDEPLPGIEELGLPTPLRRGLQTAISRHVYLGQAIKPLEAERKGLTDSIKDIWAEDIGDETKSFYCELNKVTRFTTSRTSWDEQELRLAMLEAGLKQDKVNAIVTRAKKVTPVVTLKITPPGEEE